MFIIEEVEGWIEGSVGNIQMAQAQSYSQDSRNCIRSKPGVWGFRLYLAMYPLPVVYSQGEGESRDEREGCDDEGGELPALGGHDEEEDAAVEDGPRET